MADLDKKGLDTLAYDIPVPEAFRQARDLVVAKLDAALADLAEQGASIRADVKQIEPKIKNLVALAESNGSVALLDGLKGGERERADLLARLEHLDGLGRVQAPIIGKSVKERIMVGPDGGFFGRAGLTTLLLHLGAYPEGGGAPVRGS
jgi:hypothetical protein